MWLAFTAAGIKYRPKCRYILLRPRNLTCAFWVEALTPKKDAKKRMCLLAVFHRVLPGAPVLLAANREESLVRPTASPELRFRAPQVLCGLDLVAGGTWLGVNEHGLVVAVTNRPLPKPQSNSPSRGQLCRRLLSMRTADEAASECARQFAADPYAGANFACIDATSGYVVSNPGEVVTTPLSPGLHVLTNGQLNDAADPRLALARRLLTEQSFASVEEFLELATQVCRRGPDPQTGTSIVLHGAVYGTVSSTLLAVTDDPSQAVYRSTSGPPDENAYVDYSPMLRQILAAGREQ